MRIWQAIARLCCLYAIGCLGISAQAATHAPSGIIIPDNFDGMAVETTEGGRFGPFAQMYTFGNGPDRIEITVVKPAHPNSSLWFKDNLWRVERLLAAGHPVVGPPDQISIASTVPNGFKALIDFDAHYKSAGVATAGFGEWVVNVLSVSKVLERQDQVKRLDRLLDQVHPSEIQTKYPPISNITKCADNVPAIYYFPVAEPGPAKVSLEAATVAGLVGVQASRAALLEQSDSLGTAPQKFCWQVSESGKTKWFRAIAPSDSMVWLSPVAGIGWTIECWPIPDVPGSNEFKFALIGNDFEKAVIAQLYHDIPDPVQTTSVGMLAFIAPPHIAYVNRKNSEIVIATDE